MPLAPAWQSLRPIITAERWTTAPPWEGAFALTFTGRDPGRTAGSSPCALMAGGSWLSNWRISAVPLPRLETAIQPTVVLLGHEHQGIPTRWVESADVCVEIPTVGKGASLNVALAGSLVLYRLAGFVLTWDSVPRTLATFTARVGSPP